MNNEQIRYLAEACKLIGIGQLAAVGYAGLAQETANVTVVFVSVAGAGGMLALGTWLLRYLKDV
ncbi:MAG: hypothetical protein ACR2RL_21545 [Gammaproteobacteria bacterium]